jgi:hypothetical protein
MRRLATVLLAVGLLVPLGCAKKAETPAVAAQADAGIKAANDVSMDTDTQVRMGVKVAPVLAGKAPQHIAGYAKVMDVGSLAAIESEVSAAVATAASSQEEYRRLQALAAHAQAASARSVAAARAQAASDAARARLAGRARIECIDVTEQHQEICADEFGDQRRKSVVIAEPNLVGRDGVVLVDDGKKPEVQQFVYRGLCVVARRIGFEVAGGQQHLRRNNSETVEAVLVANHQHCLADRRRRLFGDEIVCGTSRQPEVWKCRGDRTTRHKYDVEVSRVCRGESIDDCRQLVDIVATNR